MEDLGGCSSEEDLWAAADARLRVIVLDSGVATLFETCDGGLVSPMDALGAAGLRLTVLKRRELASFAFLPLLSESLLSLFITSANAFPRVFRKELLVEGLERGLPLAVDSAGMMNSSKLERDFVRLVEM